MKKTAALFDERNEHKKRVEFEKKSKKSVRVGEIWWYWEGINIGSEISKDGKFLRPGVVLNTSLGNGLCFIIPLTTKYHYYQKQLYIPIDGKIYAIKSSWGVLNQVKIIDRKRFCQPLTNKIMKLYKVSSILKKFMQLIIKKNSSM